MVFLQPVCRSPAGEDLRSDLFAGDWEFLRPQDAETLQLSWNSLNTLGEMAILRVFFGISGQALCLFLSGNVEKWRLQQVMGVMRIEPMIVMYTQPLACLDDLSGPHIEIKTSPCNLLGFVDASPFLCAKHVICLDLPCFSHGFREVKLRCRGVDNPVNWMINSYEYYDDALFFVHKSVFWGTWWACEHCRIKNNLKQLCCHVRVIQDCRFNNNMTNKEQHKDNTKKNKMTKQSDHKTGKANTWQNRMAKEWQTYKNIWIQICIYIYTYIYIHTYIHMYTYIYIYMYSTTLRVFWYDSHMYVALFHG